MDFRDFDKEIDELQQHQVQMNVEIDDLKSNQIETEKHLDGLLYEVNELVKQLGCEGMKFESKSMEESHESIKMEFPNDGLKVNSDRLLDMQDRDYIVAAFSGAVAVVIDSLLVKIPKDMTIVRGGDRIFQEGSSLTKIFRNIGVDESAKASHWVTVLERWFKVPYDKSVDPEILGLAPKTHRLHSLAHDPSLLGLIWGIKDIVTGTFTSLDRNGCLVVEKVAETDFSKLFAAPILWLGHLVSDIFTKMGIPIPGWSYLQLLQFGSFGEKQRSIAEVARYMYLEGYDLRHFASMSVVNAVIELIIRLYYYLVCKQRSEEFSLKAEREYVEVKNSIKLHNMLFVSYAIASCGNVMKICIYQGNPNAFNLPLWLGMIKEAITQATIILRSTKSYEKVIEARHIIDENFEYLYSMINKTDFENHVP